MIKLSNKTFLHSFLKNGTLGHQFKSAKKSYLYFCHEIVFRFAWVDQRVLIVNGPFFCILVVLGL